MLTSAVVHCKKHKRKTKRGHNNHITKKKEQSMKWKRMTELLFSGRTYRKRSGYPLSLGWTDINMLRNPNQAEFCPKSCVIELTPSLGDAFHVWRRRLTSFQFQCILTAFRGLKSLTFFANASSFIILCYSFLLIFTIFSRFLFQLFRSFIGSFIESCLDAIVLSILLL